MYQEYTPEDRRRNHEYYERTKQLKGRKKGVAKSVSSKTKPAAKTNPKDSPKVQKAKARISRLRGKISKLKGALSEVNAEMSKKRAAARKTEKKNSDGKTTAKERQSSKEYRDKHQQEIASKSKSKTKSGGSSSSSSNSVSDMTMEQLQTRATKIRGLIKSAQKQLSNANQELGQLAHSALLLDPNVKERFAQFKSAERIPSK